MTKRLRRMRYAEEEGAQLQQSRRLRFNLLWVILAVVILALVIGYDRHGVQDANDHIEQAQAYAKEGLYDKAVEEYRTALANKRLGRKAKAQVAIALGDIYFDRFENYDVAQRYYVQARQISPRSVENERTQARMKLASDRQGRSGSIGAEVGNEGTTATLIQRVELINPPRLDSQGPVVATFRGDDIQAGEIVRALRDVPNSQTAEFRNTSGSLEQIVQRRLDRALKYRAAIDEGLHRDPDVSARLYEYQQTLLAERYEALLRERSRVVSPEAVRQYYEQHPEQFDRPGAVLLGLIKTNKEEDARRAQEALRGGTSFVDVATSYSVDEATRHRSGMVGSIASTATAIPGVGEAPELVKSLQQLKAGSVTDVTPLAGAYFIFKVMQKTEPQKIGFEEARQRIELVLRGQGADDANRDFIKNLRERYAAKLNPEELERFWQSAARLETSVSATTATAAASTQTLTSAPSTQTLTAAGARR